MDVLDKEDTESVTNDADDENNSSDDDVNLNEGWADAMSKVLGKSGPKDASSLILAKSKPVEEINKEEDQAKKREKRRTLDRKRKWENISYEKPDILQKDYERNLQKIATKGVIQLFNAVKKHQKEISTKLKEAKTENKKDKVMSGIDKGSFLDMLKEDNELLMKKHKEEEKPAWSVLRDDFMVGNDMTDWDKMSDDLSVNEAKT